MIRFRLYKGRSLVSRIIRFLNWSEYSHASLETSKKTEVEAWSGTGIKEFLSGGLVREVPVGTQHDPKTVVDIYEPVDMPEEIAQRIEARIRSKVGKKYDWRGVFKFLTRREPLHDDIWFCSELVAWACEMEGWPLLNKHHSKIFPADIAYSPRTLKVESQIVRS